MGSGMPQDLQSCSVQGVSRHRSALLAAGTVQVGSLLACRAADTRPGRGSAEAPSTRIHPGRRRSPCRDRFRTRQPWRSPSPLKASSRMRSETTPFSLDGGTPESLHRPPAQRRAGGLRPGRRGPQRRRRARQCSTHTPSATGEGVDLSREPAPAAEESEAASSHDGHEDSGH